MSSYSEKQIKEAWERAKQIDAHGMMRQDTNGALIKYEEYGNAKSPFGWTIDHIIPKKLFINESNAEFPENRWALHMKNNESKADSFPIFKCVITSDKTENVDSDRERKFEERFLDELLDKVDDYGVFKYINDHKEDFLRIYDKELVKKWIDKGRFLYHDYHGKKLFSQCV